MNVYRNYRDYKLNIGKNWEGEWYILLFFCVALCLTIRRCLIPLHSLYQNSRGKSNRFFQLLHVNHNDLEKKNFSKIFNRLLGCRTSEIVL